MKKVWFSRVVTLKHRLHLSKTVLGPWGVLAGHQTWKGLRQRCASARASKRGTVSTVVPFREPQSRVSTANTLSVSSSIYIRTVPQLLNYTVGPLGFLSLKNMLT